MAKAGVVYQISCSCNAQYIGQTGRDLHTRIREHRAAVRRSDATHPLVAHLEAHPDHHVQWEQVTILAEEKNESKRLKLEAAHGFFTQDLLANPRAHVLNPTDWPTLYNTL